MRMQAVVGLLVAGLCMACGDDYLVSATGGGGTGGVSVGGNATGGAGGVATGGTATGGVGGLEEPFKRGIVALQSDRYIEAGQARVDSTVAVSFWEYVRKPTCDVQEFGDCSLIDSCLLPELVPRPAGTLTMEGALISPITMMPNATGGYDALPVDAVLDGPLFLGGEMVTATALGDQVPAFALTVTAPERTTLTSPVVSTPIPTASDLTVTWTPIAGRLSFSLDAQNLPALRCDWDGSTGQNTIPAEALSAFSGSDALLSVLGMACETSQLEDWDVSFCLKTHAVTPGEDLLQLAGVTLQ